MVRALDEADAMLTLSLIALLYREPFTILFTLKMQLV